jgi:urease accessory protein
MGWHGRLELGYRRDGDRTVAHDRHDGPLRVLQPLHPEGPGICHHVLVHPPGGLVGGDVLELDIAVGPRAHALLTTPGATRCYRSAGEAALQSVRARVASAGRLEWLPLETIAYDACVAEGRVEIALEPEAEAIGWDIVALGLPASALPFERGRYVQSIAWPGHWLERGTIDAADHRLLDSPLGFAGRRVVGTAWLARGGGWPDARRAALLEAARLAIAGDALESTAGITAAQPDVLVARVLAPAVEPAHALLVRVWRAWRAAAWELEAVAPRVWRT